MRALALILASTSRYRRELLARLRLPFRCEAPGVDETAIAGETPLQRAVRLARAKAAAVARRQPDSTVIGSDQVAVCAAELLDKPGDAARCRAQLRRLCGASATFYTAVAVLNLARGSALEFVDTTTVQVRRLSDTEIDRYVAAEQPFDCAGGFRCEGLGISLFERITSDDPTALVGLPLIGLAAALRGLGYALP